MAENLLRAGKTVTPDVMERAWMASPDHATNIMNPAYTTAGVGVAYTSLRVYVVVEFGG
jgi:uncharacterized protein YkwD